ncbi:MAG TPA: GNAT family N-acetyltransferase [Hanamia sp.]|nr:GNAT family N-acetyltransferase [Hanamia sp.]
MKIYYLHHKEIDEKKWDACIDKAANGLIYPYSFYLDAMSENWDALIADDYEKVMPLTWKKKYSIFYLYQPRFTASLGVFGDNISAQTVNLFLENIPRKFRYWDFYLNKSNLFSIPEFPMYERYNYILLLTENYETIRKGYATSHQRNIKRSVQYGNTVKTEINIEEIIELSKIQSRNFSAIQDKDFSNFKSLFRYLKEKNQAATYGVYSAQNKLVASCVFVFSNGRAYYILVGNHPDGKTSGASHLLIDAFIRDYSESGLVLDFEGSSIASLAFFYKNFGAQLEKYPGIKMNRLPAIAKLFMQ